MEGKKLRYKDAEGIKLTITLEDKKDLRQAEIHL
jgi:hypothetical protein